MWFSYLCAQLRGKCNGTKNIHVIVCTDPCWLAQSYKLVGMIYKYITSMSALVQHSMCHMGMDQLVTLPKSLLYNQQHVSIMLPANVQRWKKKLWKHIAATSRLLGHNCLEFPVSYCFCMCFLTWSGVYDGCTHWCREH